MLLLLECFALLSRRLCTACFAAQSAKSLKDYIKSDNFLPPPPAATAATAFYFYFLLSIYPLTNLTCLITVPIYLKTYSRHIHIFAAIWLIYARNNEWIPGPWNSRPKALYSPTSTHTSAYSSVQLSDCTYYLLKHFKPGMITKCCDLYALHSSSITLNNGWIKSIKYVRHK